MEHEAPVARFVAVLLSVAVCVVCVLAASNGIGGRGATVHADLADAQRYQAGEYVQIDEAHTRVAADLGRALAAHDDDARVEALGALADDTGRAHTPPELARDVQAALAVAATIALTSERDPETAATTVLDRFVAAAPTPIATR